MQEVSENTRCKAISLIQQEVSPAQIADELEISYSYVIKLKKDYKLALANGTVDKLINVDEAVIIEAGETLGLDATNAVKGVQGLERLSVEFQATALQINQRLRSLILSVEHPSELETYSKILCSLNETFLNKASTTVNVQNNFGAENAGTKHYGKYLQDAPGA